MVSLSSSGACTLVHGAHVCVLDGWSGWLCAIPVSDTSGAYPVLDSSGPASREQAAPPAACRAARAPARAGHASALAARAGCAPLAVEAAGAVGIAGVEEVDALAAPPAPPSAALGYSGAETVPRHRTDSQAAPQGDPASENSIDRKESSDWSGC